jgi:phytoene dehydrogenase-like protein
VQVVKGLVSAAEQAGVTIRTQQRATQIVTTPGDQRVTGVQLEDGSVLPADVVVANR